MEPVTKPTRNRARAREQGRFLSRKRGFMKKAHELYSKCDAEVYVVIRHNLKFYTYKASPMTDWPPGQRSIDEYYPLPEQNTPETFAVKDVGEGKMAAKERVAQGTGQAQAQAQEAVRDAGHGTEQQDMETQHMEQTD